ncbi:hypothetical protein ABPG75_000228 [Micractinium tetrahymenae]
MAPRAPAAAPLLLLLLAAAVGGSEAVKCAFRADDAPCPLATDCCSIYGWCGTGPRFCASGKCLSGACEGDPLDAPTGCDGRCNATSLAGRPAKALCRSGLVVTDVQAPADLDPVCNSTQSARVVAASCLGKGICSPLATDATFGGDPCPRVKPKVLWFQYRGVGATEGKRVTVRCPAGQVITAIQGAFYGKASRGCSAESSYRVVARRCLARSSCWVRASNVMFGVNPCPAIEPKYLFFKYKWVGSWQPRKTPNPRPTGAPAAEPPPASRPPPRRKPDPPAGGGNMGDGQRSLLWGENGELWRATGRIPDWSYAGYMANERPIPEYPVRVNVKDFGAVGDGVADDTNAIINAIERASELAQQLTTEPCGRGGSRRCPGFGNEGREGVAVLLPAGTYKVTKMVEIYQSNVVLRGEGPRRTTLYFPKGLQHVYGNQMTWAYMGGFLVLHGRNYDSTDRQFMLAEITQGLVKGDTRVQVSTTSGIEVGQWVRIFARSPSRVASRRGLLQEQAEPRRAFVDGQKDAEAMGLNREEHLHPGQGVVTAAGDGTLDAYLYGENLASSASPYSGERIRFASRVRRVGDGWVELERPLPYDVRLGWEPALYSFATPLQHSGFEGFTVDFQWDVYPQHMKAYGYNGFWLYGAANSWVRNVEIINADTGAEAQNCDFITMRDLTFNITATRGNKNTQYCDGHHGAWSAGSSNVHIVNFNFHSRFIHDLTLDVFSQECVYNNGRGKDMSLDMHRSAIHNNLWSNIDVGEGTRPFSSSGQTVRGAHAAANNTWWNIYSSAGTDLYLPDCDFGPLLNFVGQYGPPQDCVKLGRCIKEGGVDTSRLLPPYCADMLWRVEQNQNMAGQRVPLFAPKDLFGAMVATRNQRLRL